MYKLLIEDDEGGKTAVSLIRDEITIGRNESNTIRLTDRNVSRRHGRIVREDDRIFVEDVEARYGIDKNGERIADRTEFKEGDVVAIGDYRLTLKPEKQAKKSKGQDKPAPPETPEKPEGVTESGSSDFSSEQRGATQIMQAMPAKLVVISSNFAGEKFPLSAKEMVVGRGEDCDIIIDHRSISSRHAKIVREDNVTYKIVDLNSKNGVKVSGDSYRATILKRGDVIELGHVKFRFVEPGENYVFDPDAAPAPVSSSGAPAESDGGLDTTRIGLIVAALTAVLFVAGFMVLAPFDDAGGDDADDVETVNDAVVDVDELEERGDDELDEDIAAARAEIESGNLDGPVRSLEAIQRHADPSASQNEEIESLLDTVATERNFEQHYERAIDAFGDDEPLAALEEIMAIPPRSVFYDLLQDESVIDEVLEATVAVGQNAADDGDFEEARDIANEVLIADPEYRPAGALLDDIDERERRAAEEAARAEAEAAEAESQPVAADTSDQQPSQPAPPSQPEPSEPAEPDDDPGLTPEEAREQYTQAARKVMGGEPQEALDICGRALDAGHTECHRIMGLAYDRLDDSRNACRHFEQYIAANPGDRATVESQMEEHGCE